MVRIRMLREATARAMGRAIGSRFAKPIARLALAAAGLLLLAFIGKSAVAGAMARSAASSSPASAQQPSPDPPQTSPSAVELTTGPALVPVLQPTGAHPAQPAESSGRPQASPDDPVILNTANVDDLRRLPGVGEKRANAILSLRARLGGRLRTIEDLLKVKGIGRTTLKRLRPLVRLDPPALPEAGAEAPR
jgi:competence protein ComEA